MKTVTVDEMKSVLAQAPDNPRIVSTGNHVPPWALLKVIDEALPTYRINMLNAPAGIPTREGVTHESCFVGVGMRRSPSLHYYPTRLSLVPLLFRTTLAPDIVAVHVSAPIDGKVSLGAEVNVMVGAVEAVKANGGILVAQVNNRMPYTYGDGELPVDIFDAVIEADEPIAMVHGPAVIDDATRHIGELVAGRVDNGATLQLGIGAVPDATLPGLARRSGLGVWTEMFSDGILTLDRAGALDDRRPIVASFCFGSEELYEWCHRNPRVVMRRTEITNDPGQIAKQPGMTSINTALQVDLLSQANASRIKARIHSGFGGQTDFIVGALHSPGGQAIMGLRSWHPKADKSTIVPMLSEPTTSFQHSAVITEQGIAEVFGHPEKVQARNIIEQAAHPSVREELWEGARQMGLA